MNSLGAQVLAGRFVREMPEKAMDLLARYCRENQAMYDEINTYFLGTNWPPEQGIVNTTNASKGLSITIESPRLDSSSIEPQYPISPPRHRPTQRQYPSAISIPSTPISPPHTASSVRSHSSRGEAAHGEYIFLLNPGEREIEERPARMRNANINSSVMREGLQCISNHTPPDKTHVDIPLGSTPETYTSVPVLYCTDVIWRRLTSNSTHRTTFYVVSKRWLDIDILLGLEDSGEGTSEYPLPVAPQPQRPHGYHFRDYSIPVHAPTPPTQSFQRSTMYDDSTTATPVHAQPHHHRFVEPLVERQHRSGTVVEDYRLSQHSPSGTVPDRRASQSEYSQPMHAPAPTPQSPSDSQDDSVLRVRLHCDWGATPLSMWLDLQPSPEAFFHTFSQCAQRRGIRFERDRVMIYLKRDKKTPDEEAHILPLGEDEMEADWETIVIGLKEMIKGKSSNIYGKVQVGEG